MENDFLFYFSLVKKKKKLQRGNVFNSIAYDKTSGETQKKKLSSFLVDNSLSQSNKCKVTIAFSEIIDVIENVSSYPAERPCSCGSNK